MGSALVGTKVYLFGGRQYGSPQSDAIVAFDIESNTISILSAKLPTAVNCISAVTVGTKVYLFGGYGQSSNSYHNTIIVFDTENNTITTLSTKLPTAAYGIASEVVGTKVYLFGGAIGAIQRLSTINVFDAENNTIETLSATLPTAATWIASALVGTKIYLFGGYANSTLSTINMFTVSMPLATNNMLIEASATKNRFNLLPNVELGVNNVYLGNADGNGERVDAYLHNGTEWVEV